jgi:hypothetical protein
VGIHGQDNKVRRPRGPEYEPYTRSFKTGLHTSLADCGRHCLAKSGSKIEKGGNQNQYLTNGAGTDMWLLVDNVTLPTLHTMCSYILTV